MKKFKIVLNKLIKAELEIARLKSIVSESESEYDNYGIKEDYKYTIKKASEVSGVNPRTLTRLAVKLNVEKDNGKYFLYGNEIINYIRSKNGEDPISDSTEIDESVIDNIDAKKEYSVKSASKLTGVKIRTIQRLGKRLNKDKINDKYFFFGYELINYIKSKNNDECVSNKIIDDKPYKVRQVGEILGLSDRMVQLKCKDEGNIRKVKNKYYILGKIIKKWLIEDNNSELDLELDFECSVTKTYLIKNKRNGFYKIGRSNNPKRREKTLQSEEPDIVMVKVWDENIESKLHKKYNKQRLRGEWFDLNKVQVRYICTNY